jgi:hypothetical protein
MNTLNYKKNNITQIIIFFYINTLYYKKNNNIYNTNYNIFLY